MKRRKKGLDVVLSHLSICQGTDKHLQLSNIAVWPEAFLCCCQCIKVVVIVVVRHAASHAASELSCVQLADGVAETVWPIVFQLSGISRRESLVLVFVQIGLELVLKMS